MADIRSGTTAGDAIDRPAWQQALDELERSLSQATLAVARLRLVLAGGRVPEGREDPRVAGEAPAPANIVPLPRGQIAAEGGTGSPFERLWDRLEQERLERQEASAQPQSQRRGLDLLPQQYLMTVEDRERRVDLVPLHRALQSLRGIQEVSLVSFANGVPVVSLRAEGEIDLGEIGKAVGAALDRDCEVIQQDTGRLFLRLTPREEEPED